MNKRQSKKRFCFEYIEPIVKNWNLSENQSNVVKLGFYKAMGSYGRKPNLMNSEDHKKLINTANRYISESRKKLFN